MCQRAIAPLEELDDAVDAPCCDDRARYVEDREGCPEWLGQDVGFLGAALEDCC